jgi:AraC family transcriptional activator of pobA
MAGCGTGLYDSNMSAPAPPRRRDLHSYSLFGESAHLPDVLHCETIEARSALHDWELGAHRHARLHQVLLVQAGGGVARLEGGDFPLAPRSLVSVPPGEVHGFSFEPGTQGHVATLADELLDEILRPAPEVRRSLARAGTGQADDALMQTMTQIAHEFDGRASGRALALRGLATALLAQVARQVVPQGPLDAGLPESHLLGRFEALLEVYHRERWGVADYARALAVTPTHLSRVTRAATGQPASALIDDRLVREARRQLAYTRLPVGAVAEALGFTDPAHFTRVFTRATGMAPSRFRARLAAPVTTAGTGLARRAQAEQA